MAGEIAVSEKIRMFFRQLLGSRMASHLEDEMVRLRGDYEVRLREREQYISDLKEEKQSLQRKVSEYELILIPLTSGNLLGAPKGPRPVFEDVAPTNSWKAEQDRFYKQQEEEAAQEAAKAQAQ